MREAVLSSSNGNAGSRPTDPLLLTREELLELTSTRQPKRMAAWLKSRGWVFEPAARKGDIPKVDRCYYLARMSGQRVAGPGARKPAVRLDFMTQGRSSREPTP
jgi:hypothetical protein